MEAGLYNLTQDQAPLLVHYGTEETQLLLLVRMEASTDNADSHTTIYQFDD
jgi:hypothetical protein